MKQELYTNKLTMILQPFGGVECVIDTYNTMHSFISSYVALYFEPTGIRMWVKCAS